MKQTLTLLSSIVALTLFATAPVWAGSYENAVISSNPLVFFELKESSGSTMVNSINPGTFDGTYGPDTQLAEPSPSFEGVSNPSVTVSASSNGVMSVTIPDLATSYEPLVRPSYSVEMLVQSQSFPDIGMIFSKGGVVDGERLAVGVLGQGFGADEGKLYLGTNSPYHASSHVMGGDWTHLVMTYDGTEQVVNLYANGVLVLADLNVSTYGDTGGVFTFGARFGSGPLPMSGSISNIAIYDYALDASAVSTHWAAATAIPEPGAVAMLSAGGLVLCAMLRKLQPSVARR